MAKNKNTVVELVETTTEIEAPYELPEGWKWCCWGDIGKFVAGNGFKEKFQGLTNLNIPFYKVGSLKFSDSYGILYDRTNTINEDILKELKANLIPTNSIIFAKIGEAIRLNRRSFNSEPCCIDNNLMAFICTECNYKYVFYWSKSLDLYNYTNATTVPAIRKSDLENILFPLPPTLEEQQRIVNRIETLFAKLDQAKEKAQNVVDTFETRKASILHKAFNNQLKIDNEELTDEGWIETTIGETVKLLSGQDFKPEDYNDLDNGIPYITGASNFEDSHVIINRWTTKPTVIARKNDVLLVCKGSGYGKTIIADFDEAHIARQIMALQPNDKVNNKYIQYFLQNNYEYLRNCGQGLIPGISRSVVLEMKIKLPPINYQLSIVNFLDTVLEKENQAKEAAEAVLEQIDLLKKSILARAFRGAL